MVDLSITHSVIIDAVRTPVGKFAGALSSVDASIEREGGRLGRRIPTDVVGQFGRCERVVVTVGYKIPSVQVPVLGYTFGTRKVSATHSEVVDPYRSGLDGEVGGECV